MFCRRSREPRSYNEIIDDMIKTSASETADMSRSPIPANKKSLPREERSWSKNRTPKSKRERRRNESRGKSRTPDEARRERRRPSNSRSKSRRPDHTIRRIIGESPPHGKYGSGSPRHQRKEQTKSPLHEGTPRRSPSRKETPTPRQNLGSMPVSVCTDELILEPNGIDVKSLSLQVAQELSKRPKKGEIHNQMKANVKSILKRILRCSQLT